MGQGHSETGQRTEDRERGTKRNVKEVQIGDEDSDSDSDSALTVKADVAARGDLLWLGYH
jgi:hypothetical protein